MKNKQYIIDFSPSFLKQPKGNGEGIEKIIKKAIYLTFLELSNQINLDIEKYPLTNKCDIVRNTLGNILKHLESNIPFNTKYLETQEFLDNDVTGHSLLIMEILDTSGQTDSVYLIDPTYSQFFLQGNCSQSNYLTYSNIVIKAPDPGYYFIEHPEKLEIARELLQNGYIKLTEEVAKAYCDSFYKTRRGSKAYFDLINNPTEISGKIYLKSLLNHKEKSKSH